MYFIDNFAGRTCAVATMDAADWQPMHPNAMQDIGASSIVQDVPRYQEIVAPRRRPSHLPVLTYSLISRQLRGHGSPFYELASFEDLEAPRSRIRSKLLTCAKYSPDAVQSRIRVDVGS